MICCSNSQNIDTSVKTWLSHTKILSEMQSEVLLTGDQFYRYQLKDIKVFSIQIAEHS